MVADDGLRADLAVVPALVLHPRPPDPQRPRLHVRDPGVTFDLDLVDPVDDGKTLVGGVGVPSGGYDVERLVAQPGNL